jgi:transposase-like protein
MIMTKDHLYWKYLDALNAQHFTQAKLLSLTHFCNMFKGEHRHIKFPWFCVLRQCYICASTNDTLTNQTMSTRERAQLKQWKLDHLKLVKAEQKAYHLHQQEAVADPGVTLPIIMDGLTDVILPLLVPLPLVWKDLHLYKLGIHGFINHGLHHCTLYLHQG